MLYYTQMTITQCFMVFACFDFCVLLFCFVSTPGLPSCQHALTTTTQRNHDNNGHLSNNSRLYQYHSGSDGEGDHDGDPGTRHTSLNVHHMGSQCSISSNELNARSIPRTEAVSQLSLSDSDQEDISHSNLHHSGKVSIMGYCFYNLNLWLWNLLLLSSVLFHVIRGPNS